GELAETRWSDALAAAARAIKTGLDRSGPSGTAVIGGSRLTNESAYAWAKLAKGVIGTDSVDAQLGDGLDPRLVLGLPRATIAETCAPGGTILVFANDVKEELGVLYLRLRHAAVWDGAKVIEVSATDTGITSFAAASVRARPGAGPAVIDALLAGGPAPDGIDADVFARAAGLLGDDAAGPLRVVLGRPSLAESADVATAAAHTILARRQDATFLTTLRRANVYGAIDMGLAPGLLPGRVGLDAGRAAVASGWGIAANELPGSVGRDAAGILAAAADGTVDTLILLGADPVVDFADHDLAERALQRTPNVISVDLFATESNKYAHVVLPASGFAASDGTTTNLEGRVTRVGQAIAPPGKSHADWVIAAELAFALDNDLGFDSLEDIRAEIARTAPSHAGLTEQLLDDDPDGTVFPLPTPAPEELDESTADTADVAGDGDAPSAEATTDQPTDDRQAPSVELPPAPGLQIPAPDAYAFRLVVTRKLYDQGTIVQQSPHLAPLATPPAEIPARLNPADIAQLGITDGASVRISGARGQITLPVLADAGVPRGLVAFTRDAAFGAGLGLIEPAQTVTDVRVETVA
ncbi:MAG TPA: molybdopterin-dependent oxidoreductase, partial [Acidimicrobiales bacterium]|nr:molybdopterin-dependent oxidoreductase [Acidimicrobiales bacterium]